MKAAKHNTGRLRRFCKWAGLMAATGFIFLWIASGFAGVLYTNCSLPRLVIVGAVARRQLAVKFTPIDARVQWRPRSGLYFWLPEKKLFDESESWTIPTHRTLTMAGLVDPQNLYRPTEEFTVPIWLLVVIFATAAGIAWRRDHVIGLKLKSGACPHCAFNLSGLAPDAVCPECGVKA